MPMQFNMLHILPQAKFPKYGESPLRLPLDVFIANHVALLRKKERSQGRGATITAAQAGRQMTAREEMEEFAISQGLLMIPEFQFDHCLFQITQESLAGDVAM